jgi:hypothetical protein
MNKTHNPTWEMRFLRLPLCGILAMTEELYRVHGHCERSKAIFKCITEFKITIYDDKL